jgi:hypothetical protein
LNGTIPNWLSSLTNLQMLCVRAGAELASAADPRFAPSALAVI